ncbi:MAG: hypothetical protein JST49_04195 [Bacteroidetes bacterium]|nr:hypothetical protein [Bacteroidota bacterium]
MKKVFLTLAAISALYYGQAQDGNNICVWNAMNTYNTGGGAEELERAIKCADEAAVHEVTAPKAKTWFYRAQLYTLIFQNKDLKKKYGNAGLEAVKAFKKLYDINDPKFRDWEDVQNYAIPLATSLFNEGVDQFQSKNYAQAYDFFYSIKDLNKVIEGKGKKSTIDLPTALKNAAISAENSGNAAGAMAVYKDWIATAPDPNAYYRLSDAQKKAGQRDESKKTIDEAIAKYPKDANLLVGKINFFLEDSNYTAALSYVNNLIEVEPKNDGALFIKGLAFEKLGNEDSVVYYYKKAAEVNPKNDKAWNNLGAFYVNKTVPIINEMNNLGNTAADTKRYEELKKTVKELYLKGKPYLEKALEANPDDARTKQILTKINLYTGE